ncbi:MAG: hypothetical protein ACXVCI_22275 [Bdellovibrionota bacterium]
MRAAFLFLLLAFIAPLGHADDSNTDSTPVVPRATRHGGKLGKSFSTEKKTVKSNHTVRGHCTMLETPLNPITGPCVSVPLELKNDKGVSLGISRTSAQGDFVFEVEDNGPYHLTPSSTAYVLAAPIAEVKKGQTIDLKIKQKN